METSATGAVQPTPKVRLMDQCRHFLGEVVDRKIRIYCTRCKRFLSLSPEELKQHMGLI